MKVRYNFYRTKQREYCQLLLFAPLSWLVINFVATLNSHPRTCPVTQIVSGLLYKCMTSLGVWDCLPGVYTAYLWLHVYITLLTDVRRSLFITFLLI